MFLTEFSYTLFTKVPMLFRISLLKRFIYVRVNTSQILLVAAIPVTLTNNQVKAISIHFIKKNLLPLRSSTICPQEKSNHKKNHAYLTDSEYFTCLLKKRSHLQHLLKRGHLQACKTSDLSSTNHYFQIPTFLINENCSRYIL